MSKHSQAVPTTQHRPPRENARAKELADSKRKVAQLSREVSRLRRQLEKRGIPGPADEEETMAAAEAPPAPKKVGCIACGCTEFTIIESPGRIYRVCKSCKRREIVKADAIKESNASDNP